jgi:hypothetical protein
MARGGSKDSALARAAKILGEKGGKKGGPARAAALTKAQRSDIARMGGKAKAKKQSQGG